MYTQNTAWKYIEIHNTLHILYCVCVLCIRPLVCVAYYVLCIMYCVCVLFICCEYHTKVVDLGQIYNFGMVFTALWCHFLYAVNTIQKL